MDEQPLHTPEGIRYNCEGCGRCCAGWSVGMTQEDYDRIKHVDWGEVHPDLKGKELFIHREAEFKAGTVQHPHYTAPRADGTCSFLINKLCAIHGHLGEDQKPLTCRIFPYSFVETPSGIYTGVVYNSMAAAKNVGKLLSEQEDELRLQLGLTRRYAYLHAVHEAELAANNPQAGAGAAGAATSTATSTTMSTATADAKSEPPIVKDSDMASAGVMQSAEQVVSRPGNEAMLVPNQTVELTMGLDVTWDEFLVIDGILMDLCLNRKDLDIFQLCPAISEVLIGASKLKRAGKPMEELRSFDPVIPQSGDMTPGGVEEMTIRSMFYRFYIYPVIRVEEMGLWQLQRKEAFSSRGFGTVVRSFSRYSMGAINTILFKTANVPKAGKVNLEKTGKQKFEPLSQDVQDFFRRWIYLRLFAKTYFGAPAAGFTVISGFNCLMAALISALLFVKATAILRKENSIKLEDLWEAYWRLDRELLTMAQVPKNESRAYNFAFATPRLFHKMLAELGESLK